MSAVRMCGRGLNILTFLVIGFVGGQELAAQTPTGRLVVTVVNTAGEPMEGARISAAEASVLSDVEGLATLVLPSCSFGLLEFKIFF